MFPVILTKVKLRLTHIYMDYSYFGEASKLPFYSSYLCCLDTIYDL